MTEPLDWSDPEEIERRFEEGIDRLMGEGTKASLRAMADHNKMTREVSINCPHPMTDFMRLLEEAGDKVPIDALLPAGNKTMVQKPFFAPQEFIAFFDVASALNSFSPEDDADRKQIDALRSAFGQAFTESLSTAQSYETYLARTGEALFDCRFDTRVNRGRVQLWRNPKRFKACLVAEANRFTRKSEWRQEEPQLAEIFEECFRILSKLIFGLSRGQQLSSDPNVLHLRHILAMGGEETRKGLLTPGVQFNKPGGGAASPMRQDLLDSIGKRQEQLRKIGVTREGMKEAFRSLDRKRQGRRGETID